MIWECPIRLDRIIADEPHASRRIEGFLEQRNTPCSRATSRKFSSSPPGVAIDLEAQSWQQRVSARLRPCFEHGGTNPFSVAEAQQVPLPRAPADSIDSSCFLRPPSRQPIRNSAFY